ALDKPSVQAVMEEVLDTVTGLPCRVSAVDALVGAQGRATPRFAVPLIPDRPRVMGNRFGTPAAGHGRGLASQVLPRGFRAGEVLFRWSGPALLAIMERNVPVESVRLEMTRVAGAGMECTVQFGGRMVLLPVTISWMLLPIQDASNHDELVRQIDQFVH